MTPRPTKAALVATLALTAAAFGYVVAAQRDGTLDAADLSPDLWLLTALFAVRVAGQVLVALRSPSWLPPMQDWNLVAYRVLLPVQLVILAVMTWIDASFSASSGPPVERSEALGLALIAFSAVYGEPWPSATSFGCDDGPPRAGSAAPSRSSSTSFSRRTSTPSGASMSAVERVVIVGAGAAGLSTAAALTRRGIDALVIDRSDRIGGSWASRYERLHLHTIRRFSGLAHHGIPRRYPRYLSKDEYAAYLGEYAKRFGLRVALGEDVTAIHPAPGEGHTWEIEHTALRTVETQVAIVATGHYAEPQIPAWEGIHEYEGRLIHSAAYRSGREFAGSRALVVGLGNSGAEIATDLVEQGAAAVSVAVRTPPPIVTREMFGVVPVQLFGIALMPLGILGPSIASERRFGNVPSAICVPTESETPPGGRSPHGDPRSSTSASSRCSRPDR